MKRLLNVLVVYSFFTVSHVLGCGLAPDIIPSTENPELMIGLESGVEVMFTIEDINYESCEESEFIITGIADADDLKLSASASGEEIDIKEGHKLKLSPGGKSSFALQISIEELRAVIPNDVFYVNLKATNVKSGGTFLKQVSLKLKIPEKR